MGLPAQVGVALALGALVGIFWPTFGAALQPISAAFVAAVKMVVIPLVFCGVAVGTMNMALGAPRLGRIAVVAFGWFYCASLIAILIGLALDALFHPGQGVSIAQTGAAAPHLAGALDWSQFLLGLIPANIVAAMAQQELLPTLVFAALFGFGLASLGAARAKPLADVLSSVLAVMFRLTRWVVALTPLAVFAVVAWLLATQGSSTLWALSKLVAVVYLGCAICALGCIGGFALLHPQPLQLTRQMLPPALLGFVTRSSQVALPLHVEKLEALGFPNRIVSVILPLGYSFNLDGAALYLGVAAMFAAEAYGLHGSFARLSTIALTALLASKAVANVPSGGLVALSTVLLAAGVPAEAVALVAGVDVFMDMARTSINVFANTLSVLVVYRFGEQRMRGD